MKNLDVYLDKNRTLAQAQLESKKQVLEQLAGLLAEGSDSKVQEEIYHALQKREKVGSTALGKGLAIPHARIEGLKSPRIALLSLNKPLDYDAPDDAAVDLFIGLLVPAGANTLQMTLLQQLVPLLRDPEYVAALRSAEDDEDLYETFASALPQPHETT